METQSDTSKPSSLQDRHDETLVELKLYKLLVNSVQDYAIFFMDTEGYIQTWNKGARATKGYSGSEIIGKHFSVFYLQRDKNKKKPELELKLAREHGRVEDESWRVKKDGTRFWANVIITALYDDEETLIGFAKVTRDLSERKRQEDRLKKTNVLLKKQRHELRQLNVSKDEFISLASHQLRTPATGVKQYVGMVREGFAGALTPKQGELLERAYESNERQLRVISDLLRVAQVDAGKVTPRKTLTNINDILASVIAEQFDTYESRHQTIVHRSADQPVEATVDSNLIRMVLENIINNASKYSHRNTSVAVAAYQKGTVVCIDVQDSGVGIEVGDMPRLFGKFSRIDNDLSTEVGGTGLGLYWAKKIVDLHGGSITLRSKMDEGSIFTVELPR